MKKLKIDLEPYENHLLALVTGEYDLDEALEGFSLLLAACQLTGRTRVVVDFRRMGGIPQATEKTVYALIAAQYYEDYRKGGGQALRIAYLGAAPAVVAYEPGLDIVRQRNLPFRLFTSEQDAFSWLRIEPPEQAADHGPVAKTAPP